MESTSFEKRFRRVFLIGAWWNLLGAGSFFLFAGYFFRAMDMSYPSYPAFFQAWLALAFVFGVGYWYVARDLYKNSDIARLGIYGKTAFAAVFIFHVWSGSLPAFLLLPAAIDVVFVGLYALYLAQLAKVQGR